MSCIAYTAYTQTPQEIGTALAERMRGIPEPAFLQRLDETLGQMQAVLMDEGCSVRSALLICREAREIAREEWQRVS